MAKAEKTIAQANKSLSRSPKGKGKGKGGGKGGAAGKGNQVAALEAALKKAKSNGGASACKGKEKDCFEPNAAQLAAQVRNPPPSPTHRHNPPTNSLSIYLPVLLTSSFLNLLLTYSLACFTSTLLSGLPLLSFLTRTNFCLVYPYPLPGLPLLYPQLEDMILLESMGIDEVVDSVPDEGRYHTPS